MEAVGPARQRAPPPRARANDLAKQKKLPQAAPTRLPAPTLDANEKFASLSQQTAGKAKSATDWPSKVG